MKMLLLAILLLLRLAAHGQAWAGGLPLDSASGKIMYQGREAVPGTPAPVLRKRALTYARHAVLGSVERLVMVDSTQGIALFFFVRQSLFNLQYRLTVQVTDGSYHYSLSDCGYTIQGAEGFSNRGRTITREPNRQVTAEAMWQDVRGGYSSFRPTLQKQLVDAAGQDISELKAAMK